LDAVCVTVNEEVPLRVLPVNKAPAPDQYTAVFTNAFPVTAPAPPVSVRVEAVNVLDIKFSGEVCEMVTGAFTMVAPVTVCAPVPDAIMLSRLPMVEPGCPVRVPATFRRDGVA
jgi:hypothetical protein